MSITRFKYKVLVLDKNDEIMDLSPFFIGGDVIDEINTPSTARFEFVDKVGMIENSMDYSRGTPIVFSVSTDSGNSYQRMFYGEVENIDISLAPSGEKTTNFNAYGSPVLRYSYLSPNHVAIGRCDIGALFTGTPTIYFTRGDESWSATWSSDSLGNYPNGLLFDSGYVYGGETDLYPGIDDIPIKIGMTSANRLDYIKQLLSPYGLNFYIEDHRIGYGYVPQFRIFPNSYVTPWDTASWVTLSFGENINAYTKRISLNQTADKILAISDDDDNIFFIYGNGRKEAVVGVSDVRNGETMRDIAESQYRIYNTIPETIEITSLPINNVPGSTTIPTYYLIGRKIKILETTSLTSTADVRKMTQNFSVDRWVTDFNLENIKPTSAILFAEIKEKLKKQEDETRRGNAYLRVDTPTSSDYSVYQPSKFFRPCAIVVGTGSPASADKEVTDPHDDANVTLHNRAFVDKPIAIKECSVVYTNETSTDGTRITTSAFAEFASDEAIGLITEVGIIGNANSGSLYTCSETYSIYRSNYATQTWPYYTKSLALSASWVVRINSIRPISIYESCSAYCWRASEFNSIKYINTNPNIIDATHSSWSAAPTVPELKKLSMDNPTEFNLADAITLSSEQKNRLQIMFSLKLPFEPPRLAREMTYAIKFNPLLACYHSESGVGASRASFSYRFWNFEGNSWSSVNTRSMDVSDWDDMGSNLLGLGWPVGEYISNDGDARLLIEIDSSSLTDTGDNYVFLEYAGATLHYKSRLDNTWYASGTELNTVVERVPYDSRHGTFLLTFKPWKITGLWMNATEDPRGMNPPVPVGRNYIDRLRARDFDFGPSGDRTFETLYDIYYPAKLRYDESVIGLDLYDKGWAREIRSVFTEEDYDALVQRGYAYFSYSTAEETTLPHNEYKNSYGVGVRDDYNGSASDLVIDMRYRPDSDKFVIEYGACGPKNWINPQDCVLMGIAIMNTESAIRYGVNKNQNIILNIQADVAGTYYTTSMASYSTESGVGTTDPVGDVGDFRFTRSGLVIV